MRDMSVSPVAASELRLGSRPSATGTLHLVTRDVPEFERPARLREFFERLGVRYSATPTGDPIEIDVRLRALPGVQLMSGRLQGACYRRTRENGDPTDDVAFVVNLGGSHLISQRGREVVLGNAEATLTSLTDPLDTSARPPSSFLVLRAPWPQLAPLVAGGRDNILRRIPGDAPALRLLADYVNIAWKEQTLASHDLQAPIVSHLYELMALALGATRDAAQAAQGGGMRAARLHSIKRDIASHLHRPDLSVSMIAARHGCTERFVQRLFETEGRTFTEYVLAQRLARARQLLTDPRRAGEKISALAHDCGFGDVSYFNRMFRRHHGLVPSEARSQALSKNLRSNA